MQRKNFKRARAKLSNAKAAAIRRAYGDGTTVTQATLAKQYGVSQVLIGRVVRGEIWTEQS